MDWTKKKAVCDFKSLSHVWLFVTPWTVAHQASLSMEFSRQEYWSGLYFLSPEDLPEPGIEPWSPASQADSLPFELQGRAKELMLLNCGVGEDSWESLGLQGDQTSQSERKSVLNIHWKDWCWSWNSNTLATDVKNGLIGKTLKLGKIEGRRRRG